MPALQKLLQRAYSEDTDEQLQVSFFRICEIRFWGSIPAGRTHDTHKEERYTERGNKAPIVAR